MAQYGKSFIYNGRSSEEFGLITAGFRVQDIPLGLSRTTMKSSMNRYRHQVNIYGVNYDDVLTFTLLLIKDPCTHADNMRFTREELRDLNAWLTSPISPRLFHMYDYPNIRYESVEEEVEVEVVDEETGETTTETQTVTRIVEIDESEEEYDYFGIFTNVVVSDNNIYALECTFECNTPYALSSEQSVVITDGSGIVPNPSDDYEDYVYPVIRITPTADTNEPYSIRIINDSDNSKYITLKNMKTQQDITLDCRKLIVKNSDGSLISFEDLNVDVVDYIYWPRLKHGDNSFRITGDATVEFIYRYPVKVGAY